MKAGRLEATRSAAPEGAAEVVSDDLHRLTGNLADTFGKMSGKRLLITGGAGFLGYYLVQAPLAWNDRDGEDPIEVTVYDSYFRGVPAWLEQLASRPDLDISKHDMRLPLPEGMGDFDYIVHAAGIASPTYYRAHPIETMDANINGLRSLLDYSVARGEAGSPVAGFLFFSSSEIYGDPVASAIPTPETYRGNVSCTGPRACYDESKRYGETLCVSFAQVHGLPVTIARPFNNYGPGMKITDGRVIADFCRNVIEGKDIVMLSDGSPSRTFCYVTDAVEGYYRVLVHGTPGEPYNVGSEGPEITMADLAGRLQEIGGELFGYAGEVILGRSAEEAYLVDNPARRRPLIDKARAEVGYEPSVELSDGLRRTLLWYSEHRWGDQR